VRALRQIGGGFAAEIDGGQLEAALVAMDPTSGEVRAMVGGQGGVQ